MTESFLLFSFQLREKWTGISFLLFFFFVSVDAWKAAGYHLQKAIGIGGRPKNSATFLSYKSPSKQIWKIALKLPKQRT